MELVEDEDLAVAFDRGERRGAHDVVGLLGRDRRALALDDQQVGVRPREREPCVTVVTISAGRSEQRGGEGVRGRALATARRADEQVRVHRISGRGAQLRNGAVLPDDFAEEIDVDGGRHRARRSRTAARTATATSSTLRVPSITTQRGVGREHPVASEHATVELVPGVLEPVARGRQPLLGDFFGHVEEHGEVGHQPFRRPLTERGDAARVEPTSVALVGDRRTEVAVADDMPATFECRADDLGDVLGAVRRHQEGLGAIVEGRRRGIEEQPADRCTQRGVAGLERRQRTEVSGKELGLGRLARPFASLERDEAPAHRSRVRPVALAERSEWMARRPAATMIAPASQSARRTPGRLTVYPHDLDRAAEHASREAVEPTGEQRRERERHQQAEAHERVRAR